jgi:hypothetical protein
LMSVSLTFVTWNVAESSVGPDAFTVPPLRFSKHQYEKHAGKN